MLRRREDHQAFMQSKCEGVVGRAGIIEQVCNVLLTNYNLHYTQQIIFGVYKKTVQPINILIAHAMLLMHFV